LKQAYRAVGLKPPSRLQVPIKSREPSEEYQKPKAFIKPVIDGRDTNYFEWLASGKYEPSSGSMHKTKRFIRRIYYGFDQDHLFLRIDPNPDLVSTLKTMPITFILSIMEPKSWKIKFKIVPGSPDTPSLQFYTETEDKAWAYRFSLDTACMDRILEMAVPLKLIKILPKSRIQFRIIVQCQDHDAEHCPSAAPFDLEVPDQDFEKTQWLV